MEPVVIAVAALALAAYVGALVFALVQIVRHSGLTSTERAIWAAAVVLFPFVAAIVWFVAGPHPFGIRVGQARL